MGDWISGVWDEVKQTAREYVDYDNFQDELDAERAVQIAEQRQTAASQPAGMPTPGFMSQVQPWLPWIVGGVVLVFVGPKLLKKF